MRIIVVFFPLNRILLIVSGVAKRAKPFPQDNNPVQIKMKNGHKATYIPHSTLARNCC